MVHCILNNQDAVPRSIVTNYLYKRHLILILRILLLPTDPFNIRVARQKVNGQGQPPLGKQGNPITIGLILFRFNGVSGAYCLAHFWIIPSALPQLPTMFSSYRRGVCLYLRGHTGLDGVGLANRNAQISHTWQAVLSHNSSPCEISVYVPWKGVGCHVLSFYACKVRVLRCLFVGFMYGWSSVCLMLEVVLSVYCVSFIHLDLFHDPQTS